MIDLVSGALPDGEWPRLITQNTSSTPPCAAGHVIAPLIILSGVISIFAHLASFPGDGGRFSALDSCVANRQPVSEHTCVSLPPEAGS